MHLTSRDRLSFSKSILRRFIRDCVDRDAAVASPWTVKPAIANKYGVISSMPEATRKNVEDMKKGEHDKESAAMKQTLTCDQLLATIIKLQCAIDAMKLCRENCSHGATYTFIPTKKQTVKIIS